MCTTIPLQVSKMLVKEEKYIPHVVLIPIHAIQCTERAERSVATLTSNLRI